MIELKPKIVMPVSLASPTGNPTAFTLWGTLCFIVPGSCALAENEGTSGGRWIMEMAAATQYNGQNPCRAQSRYGH